MFSLNKKQIRQNIVHIRNNLSQTQKFKLENLIIYRFNTFINPLLKKEDLVAGYYPTSSELNILQIIEKLPTKFLLPSINSSSKIIKFYSWGPSDELCPSKYASNILEPKIKINDEVPNIIIAPLIACDLQGNRLGSGKAMYDATIAELRKQNPTLIYIGLCYDFQLINELPVEEHDQKLDFILTESRAIVVNPSRFDSTLLL